MTPRASDDEMITEEKLRNAVTYEVRSQLTPILLQLDQATADLRTIKWTLFGNVDAGEEGLVKNLKKIQVSLELLQEGQSQRLWMQRGLVAGVGIQLLSTTGIFEWFVHLIKALP